MSGQQDLADNLSATNDAMRGLIAAANKGEFTITPDAGDELITIFQELEDRLQKRLAQIDIAKRRTPLGPSPAGRAISDFNKQVASGDNESLEHLITSMRNQTPQVVEAIKKAMATYQQHDEQNKQILDDTQK
ncbi:hypothetical protein [Actinopolyspora mortivallis]|uniref:hypothetical protein n=1 Tax=Actinopolyspora mortivallis TaxID=33906 RepID=UPI0015E5AE06|nr:hypothetical protein [Actinopolyspora mortivallis]